MPLSSILILTGIVSAFATFGLALAWGQYQTQQLYEKCATAASQAPRAQDDMKMAA
jgi:multisubunit Na+/H+ antiporter MnhC subunit